MSRPLIACAIGALLTALLSVKLSNASEERNVLPLCPPVQNDVPQHSRSSNSNVLLVSTLDGQLTALDMEKSGSPLWSIDTGPEAMLSSTISQVALSKNSQYVKLIPSLSGSIYKFDGSTIEPVPMTAETLLKASFKFGDDMVMTGGKESKSYGIDFSTGKIIYECASQGCVNWDSKEADETSDSTFQDILVVQRESQTVRAVEPRTGNEKWNFSVAQHHLQYYPSIDEICEPAANLDDEGDDTENDHEPSQDDEGEIKAVVSDGVVCQVQQNSIIWKQSFPSPIVQIWRFQGGKLNKVNLFSNSHIPRRDLSPSEDTSDDLRPLLYLGSYKSQLYIQESERQRKTASKVPQANQQLQPPFYNFPRITWRPYLISASSRTPFINHGSEPPPDLPLLTHDKRTAENTALAVVGDAGSDYPFDSGLYLFPDEPRLDYDFVEDLKNKSNSSEGVWGSATGLSLLDYWKEVVFISLVTAVITNLLFGGNSRSERQRSVLIVEKRVEVPVEVKVEVPVPLFTREESFGSTATSGSEPSRNQPFVSRFLTDYEPLRCLGHGGFGVVFESKNRIDDGHYAVKRVQLPTHEDAKKKVMREVKFLAKLDHKNIVRYYNTWVECPPPDWQKAWDSKWRDLDSSLNGQSNPNSAFSPFSCSYGADESNLRRKPLEDSDESSDNNDFSLTKGSYANDSLDIVFEASKRKNLASTCDSTSGGIAFEYSNSKIQVPTKENRFSASTQNHPRLVENKCSDSDAREAIVWDEATRPRSYLYIVMQLCQRESLRHWLKTNCDLNPTIRSIRSKAIFHEICHGVEYVHSQGLIHRDLKPSNIFFSNDGTIKIGDFGLVTGVHEGSYPENTGETDETIHMSLSSRVKFEDEKSKKRCDGYQHTDKVGTELYMSPEQVARKLYNHKVDIYSLGMIYYELLEPFQTQMERVNTLKALRSPDFSFKFSDQPEFLLVQSMLSHQPDRRPDAADILKMDFIAVSDCPRHRISESAGGDH